MTRRMLGGPGKPHEALMLEQGKHIVAVAMEPNADPLAITLSSVQMSVALRAKHAKDAEPIAGCSWIVCPELVQGEPAEHLFDMIVTELATEQPGEPLSPALLLASKYGEQVVQIGEAVGLGVTTLAKPHCAKCGLMNALVFAGILEHAAFRVIQAAITSVTEAVEASQEIEDALKVKP